MSVAPHMRAGVRRVQVREGVQQWHHGLVHRVVQLEGGGTQRHRRRWQAASEAEARRRRRWPRTAPPSPRPARCRPRRLSACGRSDNRRCRCRRRGCCRRCRAGSAAQRAPAGWRCSGAASRHATTSFGWLTPLMPVRNVVTRSLRGKLVGACPATPARSPAAPAASGSSRSRRTAPSSFGFEALNRSLSFRPMTTSLTSGMPSRDTCTQAPPPFSAGLWPAGRRSMHLRLAQAGGGPAADDVVAGRSGSSCAPRARAW